MNKCVDCGGLFKSQNPAELRCPACKVAHIRKTKRESMRRARARGKQNTRTCKTAMLIAFLLIPGTAHCQQIKSVDLIFAGACKHFTDHARDKHYDYNERNISVFEGTGGVRVNLDNGDQLAVITYQDSYSKRAYAVTFQKEVFRYGLIEGVFGVGVTYKQIKANGVQMFIWMPLPTLRLRIEGVKLDISPMPVLSGVVVMAYLSTKLY